MESVANWGHLNRQSWRHSWVIASRAIGYSPDHRIGTMHLPAVST